MLRSDIDAAIDSARAFAEGAVFPLPAFAGWSRADWLSGIDELGTTISRGLGWDVTDFGRGDFARYGLCLCTIRNGSVADLDDNTAQTYAEKFMVIEIGQETPFHLHPRKTEDIINRGGGVLHVEVYPADANRLGTGVTMTLVDGIETEVRAGEGVIIRPGQSIQIPSGAFHRFWAEGARVLGGEVSATNDDDNDNVFLEPFPRYASIEEDAPAKYLLVGEYAGILGSSRN
jgi:D-lyxose ketol-isomerase